ncbi:MAG: phytanoyl-CoA dioxygenase family protein [Verrucomicrobia bacterium]|nr:phytanoyl-CoA dioxygenase family protein [Verrucomicrobiota bacterium]
MKTVIDAQAIRFYRENGYIILRGVIPAPLLERLRAMAEQAREITHRINGPQAQRLQPLGDHVDMTALKEFTALPELNAAFRALLSERHYISPAETMAVFFQPTKNTWATEWHRDLRDHMDADTLTEVLEGKKWEQFATDLANFNQFNCALYEDTSTWYVPDSAFRMTDTPGELAVARGLDRAAVENKAGTRSEAEQELLLQDYCANMPGAVQAHLNAGDLLFYRNTGWHIGSYVPYRRRATLHGQVDTPEYWAWKEAFPKNYERIMARKKAGKAAAAA